MARAYWLASSLSGYLKRQDARETRASLVLGSG